MSAADDNGEPEASDDITVLPLGASCGSCVFSRLSQTDPGTFQRVRLCKRFPPRMTIAPGQGGGFVSVSQIVTDRDFCYEFEARDGPEIEPVAFG